MSSAEFRIADVERTENVERKHRYVAEFLKSRQYSGMILQKPANFSWFTGGAVPPGLGLTEHPAALFISTDSRVVVTNNVESAELFERQLAGLGFLLKERPWLEEPRVLLDDLCRGRTICSDTGFEGTASEATAIAEMRMPLESLEVENLRRLGKVVAHAIEATARHISAGQTEAEIAGEVAHRLVKHEAFPVRLTVAADNRLRHYPHWTFGTSPVRKWCTISALAAQHGLHCAATRTVFLGEVSLEVAAAYEQVSMVAASGIYFSQMGMPATSIWDRIRRIYEKTGVAEEWQRCEQAEIIGYQPQERPLLPQGNLVLAPNTPVHWHPAVGPVHFGDTILVREDSVELLTPTDDWPQIQITVKGYPLTLPGILERKENSPSSTVF